jgi:hypothetical protein
MSKSMNRFAQYLSNKHIIPNRQISFYIHWVRQCYAFCKKAADLCITSDEIDGYLKHISKQKEYWQVDQARMAIGLYVFYKSQNNKNTLKTVTAPNQWKKVKKEMVTIIRLKHLSPNTERSYIGWLRSFCRFLKTQSPQSINGDHLAVRMKNRIHNIMAKNNLTVHGSDLFGKKGLEFLNQASLPGYHRQQVQTYLELYQRIKEQVSALTDEVHRQAKSNTMAQLLMTIPGVGPITAMFMVAEIEDISRFPTYRHPASYAGLVPALDASAEKHRTGRITKQGSPHLRTALVEAAQAAARTKSRLNIFFRRRIVKSGYQKAIVATAHKIIQYAFFILKDQRPYQQSLKA